MKNLLNTEQRIWRKSWIFSLILHIVFILALIVKLPKAYYNTPKVSNAITFEVIKLSHITNIENKNHTKRQKNKKPVKDQPTKIIKETKSVIKQNQDVNKKSESKVTEKKTKAIPSKVNHNNKTTISKHSKTKDAPSVPKKKAEDVINSILHNLEKESKGESVKALHKSKDSNSNQSQKTSKSDELYNKNKELSITEVLYITNAIKKYWRPPIGFEALDDVKILLQISLAKNGKIKNVIVKHTTCSKTSVSCKLLEESAIRAVKQASPLEQLKDSRYSKWKVFDIYFEPQSDDYDE